MMKMRSTLGRIAFLLLFWSISCKTLPPSSDFYEYRYEEALAKSRENAKANQDGKDYAYHRLFLGSIAFTAGKYEEANEALRQALRVMERYGEDPSGESIAIIGNEASKTYKGDPYENMMAWYYRGMAFYFAGKYNEALISFKNALSADEASPLLEHKKDALLLFFMGAKAAIRAGRKDMASVFEKEMKRELPLEVSKIEGNNLTIVVETGRGPRKAARGSGQAEEVFLPGDCPEKSVEVWLDGKKAGMAMLSLDILQQASTGGQSATADIRRAKGTAQDLGAGFVASRADTRTWHFLPGKIFVFNAQIPEGKHSVVLKFYDDAGNEMPAYEQTWECEVKKDTLYSFRSGKDKNKASLPSPIPSPD